MRENTTPEQELKSLKNLHTHTHTLEPTFL